MKMIVKSNSVRVPFHPEKIRETLQRIGARPETINHVLENVSARVKNGMTSRRLLTIVRSELRKEDHCLAHRYNLRRGLLRLGPAGFTFEKYVAAILIADGYKALVPSDEIRGACVRHEVDVIATKGAKTAMIEAKFRNKFEDTVTLKDAMSTWARYQDLRDGAKKGLCPAFTEVWIVTNGRFSDRAQEFGDCKGIRMIGWHAPSKESQEPSLAQMVDHHALYPITVLDEVRQWELDAFAKRDYVLCRQIAQKEPGALAKQVGLPRDRAERIVNDCREVVREQ